MWDSFLKSLGLLKIIIFATIGHFRTILRVISVACNCIHGTFFSSDILIIIIYVN